jgi:short-subunit dehydrogenase
MENEQDIKWVIVTGVNGILGSAIKKELISNNLGVIGVGRSNQIDVNNTHYKYFKCDITNSVEIDHLFNQVSFLNILAIINNAGTQGPIGSFLNNEISEWVDSIHSNFIGPVLMTHKFIKLTKKNTYIVNISGGGATKPMEYFSSYAAAKTALVRFTETISIELEQNNIKTIAIAPGFLKSDFHKPIINGNVDIPENISNQIRSKFKNPDSPEFASKLIFDFIQGKHNNLNGKLISAIFDNEIINIVSKESDIGMLRRIDNQFFFDKKNDN